MFSVIKHYYKKTKFPKYVLCELKKLNFILQDSKNRLSNYKMKKKKR